MKEKKEKKKNNIIKWIIITIFFILSGILTYSIYKLNIIPNKYILIGIIVLIIINIIAGLLLLSKKTFSKIISILIYIVLLTTSIFGIYFTNEADKFLDKAFNTAIESYSVKFYVISPNEHTEKDIQNQSIAYYNNSKYVNDAIKKLNEKYSCNLILSDDINKIFENEYFLIDENTLNLFIENYELDINKYHVLYTIDLSYKIDIPKQEVEKGKHYYNIYIGGYDFNNSMDLNKIVTINTETNEILITNIHRFTYLDVPGYNKKNTLSSMVHDGGIPNNISSLEKAFDIKIDYYIVAKTIGLVTLVDDVNGIEYCSDKEFTTYHTTTMDYSDSTGYKVHVKKGCQHLNGIEALTVGRERMAFYWGAKERDRITTDIIIDIFDQMKKPANIANYSKILNDLTGMYNTSIPRVMITDSAKKMLNKEWKIDTIDLSGKNGTDNISFSNAKGAVVYPNQSSINEIKNKIKSLDK